MLYNVVLVSIRITIDLGAFLPKGLLCLDDPAAVNDEKNRIWL